MSLVFDQVAFTKLFPDAAYDALTQEIEYIVSDAKYRIKAPVVSGMGLTVAFDHVRGWAPDDHASLTLVFNPDGSLQSLSRTWDAGADGYIPSDEQLLAVDAAIEVIGLVGDAVVGPASTVAATAVAAVVDIGAIVYSGFAEFFVKLSDNGGRIYTIAVATHLVNRLLACASIR